MLFPECFFGPDIVISVIITSRCSDQDGQASLGIRIIINSLNSNLVKTVQLQFL